jgi:hypothetical protein
MFQQLQMPDAPAQALPASRSPDQDSAMHQSLRALEEAEVGPIATPGPGASGDDRGARVPGASQRGRSGHAVGHEPIRHA